MIDLVNQFGGRKDVLIISMFIFSFFLINSLIVNKKWRLVLSLIFSLFTVLEIVSLYSTQSFIGYQFYTHFNLRGVTGISGYFIPQIIIILFIFLVIMILNYSSLNIMKRMSIIIENKINKFIQKIVIIGLITLSFIIISTMGNFTTDTRTLFTMFHTNTEGFRNILNKNGMSDYVTSDMIECEAGKNIIVISIESLERAFLSKKYSSLTPNINKLKQDWHYYDLEQNEGSGWTSGSLYTYLTGFPAFFGVYENAIFQTTYHSEISSISHLLNKLDYNTVYLNGNTYHSGINDMLITLNFSKIIDINSVKKSGYESGYGIRDKDLFEFAKKEIEKQQESNQQFALFISTNDTHYPNGIYDKRMEAEVLKKKSEFEFMIAAVDYLIGDFIDYLKKNELLNSTVVYIFPDHIKMGDPTMFKGTGKRGLYLITNSETNINPVGTTLYQIDLPKSILNGAGINHNLKFLTDYIGGDKNEYIKKNRQLIQEINTNGLLRINSKPYKQMEVSKNYQNYKKDKLRFIAHAGGIIDGNTYTNSKEALDLSYSKGFRLFELDIRETKDGKFVAVHDWDYWSKITNFKGKLPATNKQFIKHKLLNKYTPLDMKAINEWFLLHKDAILVTDKINKPLLFSKSFIDSERLIMELFDIQSVKEGINSNILSAMPSQFVVDGIGKSDIKKLAEMGVKNIAISGDYIINNKELLLEFKYYKIKTYAFNINYAPGISEDFFVKYQLDYFYGIYADDWSFE